MDGLTVISESIGSLYKLSNKTPILLDDVQTEFRADLQSFIVGETLTMQNRKIVIGNNLYNRWLEKIGTKGLSGISNNNSLSKEKSTEPGWNSKIELSLVFILN